MSARKRLLSGIQPSGQLHIGNYLGAMRQFVELQDEYDTYIFIANYHALTTIQDPEKLRENTINSTIDYLAVGLDPEKVTLFVQSDVPQVTELAWIFNILITVPYLSRALAYKDKVAQGIEPTVGLFDYPVLMAADILLPDADVVPVGADQKQHVEIARDIAEKFNTTFGETFKIPEPLIPESAATVPGTDGRKMSKSYGNTIPLFAEDEELKKAVMSIVTDSKGTDEPKDPETCNVFSLHRHFSEAQLPELEKKYKEGKIGYKESKEILLKNLKSFIAPLRDKRNELAMRPKDVISILDDGAEKMRKIAEKKMHEIHSKVGITFR